MTGSRRAARSVGADSAVILEGTAELISWDGTLVAAMETSWRNGNIYSKTVPDKIIAGGSAIDAYALDVRRQSGQTIYQTGPSKGGVALDGSRSGVYFHGIEIEHDPTFEALDALLGAITYPWTKRMYFLNSRTMKLRPITGHWMLNRTPPRMYDRYVHYRAITSKYRFTTNQRNANTVLSIA